jgi:hypothetical protein
LIKIEVDNLALDIDGQVNYLTRQEAKELQRKLENILGPIDRVTFPDPPTLPPQDKQPWTGDPYTSNTQPS